MSDQTLLGTDISGWADKLIKPFAPERVRGASYDVSAGDDIIIALSERQGGHKFVNLKLKASEVIPPGHTAIVYSKEEFSLPLNMKGRLSLRAEYATRMIFFAGGIVDPGFAGRLWLPIANLSSREFEIHYDERMFRIEFVLLTSDANKGIERERDMPTLPLLPQDPVYDPADLSRRLEFVEEKARLFEPSSTIVQAFLLSAVAGVAAGGIFAAVQSIDNPKAAMAVGLGIGVIALPFLVALLLAFLRSLRSR